ncbi:MAG TPA: ABC transporter ATP-binding protein [Xanthobacteraceae bacterium]|nr:ABC transporter ATP-binding protein [Xanthobacteraceae bacterium]
MTLELRNVTKRVEAETHIADVSLTLARGSLNVLLGPTLSGKTTLLRLMAGLDVPTQGQVLVNGQDVTDVPVQKRSVAMVYQQFINFPNFTVFENIASPLRVAGVASAEIDRRVRDAAALMRLDRFLERYPLELSGGQQQRTALARAVVKRAELLLLDEPLANLDYKLREELREELPKLFVEIGAITVYATAEPSDALLLGGNTATLSEGRITQFGKTVDVYRRPNDKATADVFSDPPMNFIAARITGGKAHLPGGTSLPARGPLAGLPDGEITLGFRANHLYLRAPGPDAVPVTATVAVTEITGSESFVHVMHEGSRWVALAHGIHELNPGAPVELYLDPNRVFVFGRDGRLMAAPAIAAAA